MAITNKRSVALPKRIGGVRTIGCETLYERSDLNAPGALLGQAVNQIYLDITGKFRSHLFDRSNFSVCISDFNSAGTISQAVLIAQRSIQEDNMWLWGGRINFGARIPIEDIHKDIYAARLARFNYELVNGRPQVKNACGVNLVPGGIYSMYATSMSELGNLKDAFRKTKRHWSEGRTTTDLRDIHTTFLNPDTYSLVGTGIFDLVGLGCAVHLREQPLEMMNILPIKIYRSVQTVFIPELTYCIKVD